MLTNQNVDQSIKNELINTLTNKFKSKLYWSQTKEKLYPIECELIKKIIKNKYINSKEKKELVYHINQMLRFNRNKICDKAFSLLTIIINTYMSDKEIIKIFEEVVTSIPELAHNKLYDIEINILKKLIKSESLTSRELKEKLSNLMIEKLKNLIDEKRYADDWIALLEFIVKNKYINLQSKEDLNNFANDILYKDKNNFADKILEVLALENNKLKYHNTNSHKNFALIAFPLLSSFSVACIYLHKVQIFKFFGKNISNNSSLL